MLQGFANSQTAARVAQAIKDATGEVVAERTIARRAAEWRMAQSRLERAREQYRAMKEAGLDGVEMLSALAFDHLVENPDALTGADPVEFHALGLKAEQLALKKREIAVRERQVSVVEAKLGILEAREERLKAALGGQKKAATAEERLREVYSILQLKQPEAHVAA